MLKKLKLNFAEFSKSEKLFVLGAMLCGFFIQADYSIIRPVSNSLFIHAYSAQAFPYAWLAGVPINLLLVLLYNHFLPKLGPFRMFFATICAILFGNLFCALFIDKIAFLPFLFYVWKEVYIMLMFQQLWSVIHTTIKMTQAKFLYGVLFGIGGLGAIFGSTVPGFFAVQVGSESLLFLTVPIYVLLLFSYLLLIKNSSPLSFDSTSEKAIPFLDGLQLIRSSRFLKFILLIVIFMQIATSLIDYQFNSFLQEKLPLKDMRTEFAARIFGIMHFVTLGLQFLGSFLLVHLMGLRFSHFIVPVLLLLNASCSLFFPIFGMVALSFVTIKSFDFSLFGVIKEMLYIPLKVEEKFKAKALIDVFAHRTAKALSSFLILFLQMALPFSNLKLLSWVNIFIFGVWIYIAFRFLRKAQIEQPT